MNDVYIVGGGGFGREALNYVEDCIDDGANWKICGFLDDDLRCLDGRGYVGFEVFAISDFQPKAGDVFVCALGIPKTRKAVVSRLGQKGAKFATLVHPSVYVGRNVEIGEGTVICPNCVLTCDCRLGEFCILNVGVSVGHDSVVGAWSTLSSHCDITGHVELAEGVFFASSSIAVPSSKIGAWSTVGVNSAVVRDIPEAKSAFGTPAVWLGRRE